MKKNILKILQSFAFQSVKLNSLTHLSFSYYCIKSKLVLLILYSFHYYNSFLILSVFTSKKILILILRTSAAKIFVGFSKTYGCLLETIGQRCISAKVCFYKAKACMISFSLEMLLYKVSVDSQN